MSLLETIDAIEFSDGARARFLQLIDTTPTDEAGAIVLVAAALLLSREEVAPGVDEDVALVRLGSEFIQLMFALRGGHHAGAGRPDLRIVGGTDV